MIPDAILNQIQDRTDIVEIISAYVPLRRTGRNFKAPCPFHQEKTPSFVVSPDKQIFHCFGCHAGGNVFGFVMKIDKKDFREAVEMLAERVGIELPKDRAADSESAKRTEAFYGINQAASDFYHAFLLKDRSAEPARTYLKRRGISEATIASFKLGFAPESWDALYSSLKSKFPEALLEKAGLLLPKKDGGGYYDRFRNRVMFPILDTKGRCVAFGGRVMDDSMPKYINSPESEVYTKGRHLYGLFQARKAVRDKDAAIIVEGYMDAIACHQAGVEHVVASLGTALTVDQVRLVKRHTKNVAILYDADKAGEMATLRGLEICLEEDLEIRIIRLSGGHDPDSFIREKGKESFEAALAEAGSLFDFKLGILKVKYDARSLEGKVKIANEMAAFLARVPNEILRAAWTDELARQLSLSAEALKAQMDKSRQPKGPAKIPEVLATGMPVRPVERLLIGLMLEDAERVLTAREEIRLEDFSYPAARRIAKDFFEKNGSALTVSQWMNLYKGDVEAASLLSAASAETESVADKNKAFSDCLLWLKKSRLEAERETLRSELERAQLQGDKNRISKLLFEFNELNKGMKTIYEK